MKKLKLNIGTTAVCSPLPVDNIQIHVVMNGNKWVNLYIFIGVLITNILFPN